MELNESIDGLVRMRMLTTIAAPSVEERFSNFRIQCNTLVGIESVQSITTSSVRDRANDGTIDLLTRDGLSVETGDIKTLISTSHYQWMEL